MINKITVEPSIFVISDLNIIKFFNKTLKLYKIFKTKKMRIDFVKYIYMNQETNKYQNIKKIYEILKYSTEILMIFKFKKNRYFRDLKKLYILSIFFHQLRKTKLVDIQCCVSYNEKDIEIDNIHSTIQNENIILMVDYYFKNKDYINIDVDIKFVKLFIYNIIISTDVSFKNLYFKTYQKYIPLFSQSILYFYQRPITFFSLILNCAIYFSPIDNFCTHMNWILHFYKENNIEFKSINSICDHGIYILNNFSIPLFTHLISILNNDNYNYFLTSLNITIDIWNNINNKFEESQINNNYEKITHTSSSESSNIIDKFDNINFTHDLNSSICTTHDVSICMIDICNFSQWCANQNPENIFRTMTKYNELLNIYISKYNDITKVELVGDSVLIVGGLYNLNIHNVTKTSNIMNIAMNIINNSNIIESIFNDKKIALRIGIHNGSVYSGYIHNPRKFQLFGNAINVASRLESTALPNTINISSETMLILKDNTKNNIFVNDKVEIGETNQLWLKGVGIYNTHLCFIKKNIILIAYDTDSCCLVIKHHLSKFNYNTEIVNSLEEVFKLLKRNLYLCIILDRSFGNDNVKQELINFRIWEQSKRKSIQKICIISSFNNEQKEQTEYLKLCEYVLEKKHCKFIDKLCEYVLEKKTL